MQSFGEENQYPTASIHWSSIQKINPRRPWGTIHEPPSPLGDVCFNYGVDKVKKKTDSTSSKRKGAQSYATARASYIVSMRDLSIKRYKIYFYVCMPTSILLSYKHSLTPVSKGKKNPQDFCVVFMEEHKRVECSQTYRNFNTYKSSVCRITGRSK